MISIEENYSLKELNTFSIDVRAANYSELTELSQLVDMAQHHAFRQGLLVLGGGSNFLFTKSVDQWVIHNQLKGIHQIQENANYVWIEASAGENWHEFVRHTIEKGYGGIENLSLIPGYLGATPVQNIGAYGAEVKDVITEVKAWHIQEKRFYSFSNEDCRFGYRDSIFKHKYKNQLIITSVIFRLSKNPEFNIEYGGIRKELEKMKITTLSLKAISDAVINIRRAKLPDPAQIGNAGSFFKNPVIKKELFKPLTKEYPSMPFYKTKTDEYKIPAAWLIEQCGWKGYRKGNIGIHPHQALILVNYGGADGKEIFDLSKQIIASVKNKFGLQLQREVNNYGESGVEST